MNAERVVNDQGEQCRVFVESVQNLIPTQAELDEVIQNNGESMDVIFSPSGEDPELLDEDMKALLSISSSVDEELGHALYSLMSQDSRDSGSEPVTQTCVQNMPVEKTKDSRIPELQTLLLDNDHDTMNEVSSSVNQDMRVPRPDGIQSAVEEEVDKGSAEEDDDEDDKSVMLEDVFDEEADDPRDEDYVPSSSRASPLKNCRRNGEQVKRLKDEVNIQKKRDRRARRRSRRRSPQLWTFLLDALCDPKFNPSIIEWVEVRRGLFKLKDNKKIAEMWGRRTGRKQPNKQMNYEKFSRAIRYYYKRSIILSVPNRLTYQFGPNAKGWKLRALSATC